MRKPRIRIKQTGEFVFFWMTPLEFKLHTGLNQENMVGIAYHNGKELRLSTAAEILFRKS